MERKSKPKIWFWIVTVTLLFWAFTATGTFLFESFSDEATLIEKLGTENVDMILSRSNLAKLGYTLSGVFSVLGCALLLMRKKIAFIILVIAAIGMLIQQYTWWTEMNIIGRLSGAEWIWPVIIPGIAFFQVWLAKFSKRNNWLN